MDVAGECAAAYDVDGGGDDRGCAGFTCAGNKRRQNVASGEGRTVHLQSYRTGTPARLSSIAPAVLSAPA